MINTVELWKLTKSFCSTNKNRKNLKILVLENMVSVLQNYKCYKINTRKITNMRTNCEKGTITHQTLFGSATQNLV